MVSGDNCIYKEVVKITIGANSSACTAPIRPILFSFSVDRQATVKLECGPMPNVMVALPNIGGALCSTPQSLADAPY